MRRSVFALVVGLASVLGFAENSVVVKSVTAQQRYPWNGLVDVVVTLNCESNDLDGVWCTFVATNAATQVALPVAHITRKGDDVGSGTVWSRRFIWDASADVGAVKIDDVALTVDASCGVQLWEDGPYWAECNVGANRPEEYGYYFWWGDAVGCKRNVNNNGWVKVQDGAAFDFSSENCPTYGKNTATLRSLGYIDSSGSLVSAHDAATVHLGFPWRMPTNEEFAALVSNCTTIWTMRSGVHGRLVTGKGAYASKSIFLPAAGSGHNHYLNSADECGDYWTSTSDASYSDYARCPYFHSSYFEGSSHEERYYGRSVRPVRGIHK